MKKDELPQIVHFISEHFGIPTSSVLKIINTPTHPRELRDEFAISVLPALTTKFEINKNNLDKIAIWAYEIADEMLKARVRNTK